jgi:hypothetical protein
MMQVPAAFANELATITAAAQERASTITTGLEETATAQVTNTAYVTTFTNTTGMDGDAFANAAAAEAHMAHLIAAYQLATSNSAEGGNCATAGWIPKYYHHE